MQSTDNRITYRIVLRRCGLITTPGGKQAATEIVACCIASLNVLGINLTKRRFPIGPLMLNDQQPASNRLLHNAPAEDHSGDSDLEEATRELMMLRAMVGPLS
jgi:hypothetical protein